VGPIPPLNSSIAERKCNSSQRLAKGHPLDTVSNNGKSKMRNYNDVMTVTELTDLIAVVQSKYKLLNHELTHYNILMP